MSYQRPPFCHPQTPVNAIGHTRREYEGALSTLCAGCGHDSISAALVSACFELSLPPHRIAKLSGIGCSSKTPNYFLGNSHGFNTVHGRMPSIATGANLANRDLVYVGISGDGDSASIGLGQFAHVVRRNLNMLYIVANNGCYGLTKGQMSATNDQGALAKTGAPNPFTPIDLVRLALQLGASFVARSFSGDKAQLIPLLKAAIAHRGFAFVDVISPCVTFNNHPGSQKSYDHVRQHLAASAAVDFVPLQEEITIEQAPGTTQAITLHDGSTIHLHKALPGLDVHDRRSALRAIGDHEENGEILTGLLYVDNDAKDFHDMIGTVDKPLNSLTRQVLCPGNECLQSINESMR